jgi:dihydrofolate synthase / folylpolyglutamate synthase
VTYWQAIRYLGTFVDYEKIISWPYTQSLRLERFKGFLGEIGDPQDTLRCVHVAGTKGKGSTCAFTAYMLRKAGYKTGLYTSPHLTDFCERIRILRPQTGRKKGTAFEGMISRPALAALVTRLRPSIKRFNTACRYGPLSFFEVYTALAFLYFKEQKTDLVVLETGMGGRLDATNVVKPLACAIAPISYEHTQKLGSTLARIAVEKAGIIKAKRQLGYSLCVVSAPQRPQAMEVIRKTCVNKSARLYTVGSDIAYRSDKDGFTVKGLLQTYPRLHIQLPGAHQRVNACVALGLVESLRAFHIIVGVNAIRNGMYTTKWPGRCEVVCRSPLIVLDGAQNVASSQALAKTVRESFTYKKLILVLGVSGDKDIKGICAVLSGIADEIVVTAAHHPRACEPGTLARFFTDRPARITTCVTQAKRTALSLAGPGDLILVCGSLFLVGEFRNEIIRS